MEDADLTPTPADLRYQALMDALSECGGNQTRAAQKLGVSRATLCRWLKEYRSQDGSGSPAP